jgi:uncharacterized membrane protein
MIIVRVYYLKRYPEQQSRATAQRNKIRSRSPAVNGFPDFHRHTLLTATLVARLLASAGASRVFSFASRSVAAVRVAFNNEYHHQEKPWKITIRKLFLSLHVMLQIEFSRLGKGKAIPVKIVL